MTDLARDLTRVVLDWVHLHTHLPAPVGGEQGRRSTTKEYGHPREWASIMCAQIAWTLRDVHDNLAETLGETQPEATSEATIVRNAWNYLECRTDQLEAHPAIADFRAAIRAAHNQIENALGKTSRHEWLPTPCPGCDRRTLFRNIDSSTDHIDCGTCGTVIPEAHYPIYTRRALDDVLSREPATTGVQ